MDTDLPSVDVKIVENGKEVRTEKIPREEVGVYSIYLGKTTIPYIWQGEERIVYEEMEGKHLVNGKVYGIELAKVPFKEISSPEDVKGVELESEHFQYLPHFPNLLTVSLAEVDSNKMHLLSGLSKVVILDFGKKEDLTDEGLSHVTSLTEVRAFNLLGTPVTDKGLAYLSGMKKLETLWLQGTRITGAGLVYLSGMKKLSMLGLGDTQIVDADLKHLNDLRNLKMLSLVNTSITDEAAEYLVDLKSLEFVDLRSTNFSEAGVRKLKEALPKCKINI